MTSYLEKLNNNIENKKSFVCVGLDVQIDKMPAAFQQEDDPIFAFNKYIIDQTKDHVAAYKPNAAFYEMYGLKGIKALYETIKYIPREIPVILDAKRGDIGNTSQAYAKNVFDDLKADAVTLSPYMGYDSVAPFLEYQKKFAYVLCLTSNKGSFDLQKPDLYKRTAQKITEWHQEFGNCGAVVGATNYTEIEELRGLMPTVDFLIPGIGAQGGDLPNTVKYAANNQQAGFLINSSRAIIYAVDPAAECFKLKQEINALL